MDQEEYSEWSRLIGSFMMCFANIEFDVARALIEHGDENFEQFKNVEFSKRINKLRNYVCKMSVSADQRSRFHSVLDEIYELSKIRNLIAHNPVDLSLESIFEENTWLEVRSLRNQEHVITKNELQKKLDNLTKLQESLYELLSIAGYNS